MVDGINIICLESQSISSLTKFCYILHRPNRHLPVNKSHYVTMIFKDIANINKCL